MHDDIMDQLRGFTYGPQFTQDYMRQFGPSAFADLLTQGDLGQAYTNYLNANELTDIFGDQRYVSSQDAGGFQERYQPNLPSVTDLEEDWRGLVDYESGSPNYGLYVDPTDMIYEKRPPGELGYRAQGAYYYNQPEKLYLVEGDAAKAAREARYGGLLASFRSESGPDSVAAFSFSPEGVGGLRLGSQGGAQIRRGKGAGGGQFGASALAYNLQALGEKIRAFFTANYQASPIQTQTGTLLKAIEESKIEVIREKGNFAVKVTLADIERPARENEKPDSPWLSTLAYAPLVFYGRRAIIAKSNPLRFQIGRPEMEWITARNVRASRTDLNIWKLSDAQVNELKSSVAQAVKGGNSL